MIPSSFENMALAAGDAFQHRRHAPFFTYNPLEAEAETPTPVPTTPPTLLSSDSIVGKPLQLSTWMTAHSSHQPDAAPTPSQLISSIVPTAEPTGSNTETAESASPFDEKIVGTGVKAGVIAGIVVVSFLLLLAFLLCFFDWRKRHSKKRAAGRDSELNVLETEMRNGRAKQMNDSKTGLWEGLQYSKSDNESVGEGRAPSHPESRLSKGSRRDAVLWERVGEMRSQGMNMGDTFRKESGSTGTAASKEGHKREFRWLPAHIPGEKASLVSSAGSMSFPVSAKPAAPKSFLDGGLRW